MCGRVCVCVCAGRKSDSPRQITGSVGGIVGSELIQFRHTTSFSFPSISSEVSFLLSGVFLSSMSQYWARSSGHLDSGCVFTPGPTLERGEGWGGRGITLIALKARSIANTDLKVKREVGVVLLGS